MAPWTGSNAPTVHIVVRIQLSAFRCCLWVGCRCLLSAAAFRCLLLIAPTVLIVVRPRLLPAAACCLHMRLLCGWAQHTVGWGQVAPWTASNAVRACQPALKTVKPNRCCAKHCVPGSPLIYSAGQPGARGPHERPLQQQAAPGAAHVTACPAAEVAWRPGPLLRLWRRPPPAVQAADAAAGLLMWRLGGRCRSAHCARPLLPEAPRPRPSDAASFPRTPRSLFSPDHFFR